MFPNQEIRLSKENNKLKVQNKEDSNLYVRDGEIMFSAKMSAEAPQKKQRTRLDQIMTKSEMKKKQAIK